jgi:hypothetical protein
MGCDVRDGLAHSILIAPAVVAAVIYVIKRVYIFDLELRTHRAKARERYRDTLAREVSPNSFDEMAERLASFQPLDDASRVGKIGNAAGRFLLLPIALARAVADSWGPFTQELAEWVRSRGTHLGPRTEVPPWALALLDPEDAERYALEWAAHLHQRVIDGEIRAARMDRRRLIRLALMMAVMSGVRRALALRR